MPDGMMLTVTEHRVEILFPEDRSFIDDLIMFSQVVSPSDDEKFFTL